MKRFKVRSASHRVLSLLLIAAFALSGLPIPTSSAAAVETKSKKSLDQPTEAVDPEVGVLTGHTWFRPWGGEVEVGEPHEQNESVTSSTSQPTQTHKLKPTETLEGNPKELAGLEEQLKDSANQKPQKPSNYWKEFTAGVAVAAAFVGAHELGQNKPVPTQPVAPAVRPADVAPAAAPKPDPDLPILPQAPPVPDRALPVPAPPEQAGGGAAALLVDRGPSAISKLFPGLASDRMMQAAQRFLEGVRLDEFVAANGVRVPAGTYRSYHPDPTYNPDPEIEKKTGKTVNDYIAGYPRFWVYDEARVLYYLLKTNQLKQAKEVAEALVSIGKQEKEQGFNGIWRFSYGTIYVASSPDPEAPMGAVGWVFKALYAYIDQTGDTTHLDWLNRQLRELLVGNPVTGFPGMQVMEKGDPRYGLIQSEYVRQSEKDIIRGAVLLEHQSNLANTLAEAWWVTNRFTPDNQAFLRFLVGQRDLLMTKVKEKFWEDGPPGEARFFTSMNATGQVNRSEAWDNAGWSVWDAYDEEMAYKLLKRLETRFVFELEASKFENVPSGRIKSGEKLLGLRFFTGTFQDPYVKQSPKFEEMFQLEATVDAIFRFADYASWATNPEHREWAGQMAMRLYSSVARILELYDEPERPGLPYATLHVPNVFNTMRSTAANAPAGTLTAILRGARSDDYISVVPPKAMTVGGKAPVRHRGGLEEKSLWKRVGAFLGGAALVGGLYGTYKLSQPRPAAPPAGLPVAMAPAQPEAAAPPAQPPVAAAPPAPEEPKPTPAPAPAKPVQPETPSPAKPKPVQLEKATVTPEQLTLKLPEGELRKYYWRAFLGTDRLYPQEQILHVPERGNLTFEVPVTGPNRPGWVAAIKEGLGAVVAGFDSEEDAAQAGAVLGPRQISRATFVFQVGLDGAVTVIKGTIPSAVQPTQVKPSPAPEAEPAKPAEKPGPAQPATFQLPKGSVTPEALYLQFSPKLAGREAVAALKTDQSYEQDRKPIRDDGTVDLSVVSYVEGLENFPGWVKAANDPRKGVQVGIFPPDEPRRDAARAPILLQISNVKGDGSATARIIRGTLPSAKPPIEPAPKSEAPSKDSSGLEEMTRREFLGSVAAAGAMAAGALLPGESPAQAAQKPQGAFASLVERLGSEAEVGFIPWRPIDFRKAVRAGFNTVYISGHHFLQLSAAQQQAVIDQAEKAGLKALGFIDGDPSWSRREKRDDAQRLYNRLIYTLLLRNFKGKKLRLVFATDVEPHGDPTWQGDLLAYSDLMDEVIEPTIRNFAKKASEKFGRDLVDTRLRRIEPFWLRNGHVTDSGKRIRGLRETQGSFLGSMTYRRSGSEIFSVSAHARDRVREAQDVKLLYMVETKAPGPGIPAHITFSGRWGEIGAELTEVVDAAKTAEDEKYTGGVMVHTNWEQAERVLDTFLKTTAPPAKPEPKGAAPTKEVQLVEGSIRRTDNLLSGRLRGAPVGARVVALMKTDNFYWQPREGASVQVAANNGSFVVETSFSPPNRPGWLKAKEIVILVFASSADVTRFLATYPGETGLRRVPDREEIKPEPVRVIRIKSNGEIETSWQFFRPDLDPRKGAVVLGDGLNREVPIGLKMLTPLEVAQAGLTYSIAAGAEEEDWDGLQSGVHWRSSGDDDDLGEKGVSPWKVGLVSGVLAAALGLGAAARMQGNSREDGVVPTKPAPTLKAPVPTVPPQPKSGLEEVEAAPLGPQWEAIVSQVWRVDGGLSDVDSLVEAVAGVLGGDWLQAMRLLSRGHAVAPVDGIDSRIKVIWGRKNLSGVPVSENSMKTIPVYIQPDSIPNQVATAMVDNHWNPRPWGEVDEEMLTHFERMGGRGWRPPQAMFIVESGSDAERFLREHLTSWTAPVAIVSVKPGVLSDGNSPTAVLDSLQNALDEAYRQGRMVYYRIEGSFTVDRWEREAIIALQM